MSPQRTSPPAASGLPTLALLVALLLLPMIVASGLYLSGWQPSRRVSHGQLFSPPLALPAQGLRQADGKPLASTELQGKWLLVLFGNGPCTSACEQRIDEMRRIQVSLNQEMSRVQRIVLSDPPNLTGLQRWHDRQADLLIAAAPADWLPSTVAGPIYRLAIVDPRGYLVLTYPAQVAAAELRADLERLLKFSWNS